jgi:hypothetical protein
MDARLFCDTAPPSSLAVEHTHNSRALVHIPNLEQAATFSADKFFMNWSSIDLIMIYMMF